MATAVADQETILKNLMKVGRNTEFGKEAGLDKVNNYEEFRQAVPIRDYEANAALYRPDQRRKAQCTLERQAHLFCQNLRHHQRHQVYSDYQRLNSQSYQYGPQCPALLYG